MRFILFLFTALFFFSCAKEINTAFNDTTKIQVGKGPEDLVLDQSTDHPRLIISCGDFRNMNEAQRKGSIYHYDLHSNNAEEFIISNLPDSIKLFPHGISLLRGNLTKLYVINHSYDNDSKKHAVLVFIIKANELIFDQVIMDEKFLTSPNDLSVLPDGSFYITNTGSFSPGSFFKRLFTSLSNVVFYNATTKSFKVVYDDIWVANGIQVIDHQLYVANSFNGKLHVLKRDDDGSLILEKKINVGQHLDNISWDSLTNKLYIASHDSFVKLNKSKNKGESPFGIYEFDLKTETVREVMHNDGSMTSGVSTALKYEEYFYLGQIFGDYIERVKF